MRYQGRITRWNDDRGFGFVEPNGGGTQAFVHIKAFVGYSRRPVDGDVIVYEVELQADGRHKAKAITLVGDKKRLKKTAVAKRPLGSAFTLIFATFLVGLTVTGLLPFPIPLGYLVLSLFTYLMYNLDKSAAQKNQWRTSESTLHMLGLLGGWPGALVAQIRLRHKSSKSEFLLVYWITVILNLVAFMALLSPRGQVLLVSVFELLGQ